MTPGDLQNDGRLAGAHQRQIGQGLYALKVRLGEPPPLEPPGVHHDDRIASLEGARIAKQRELTTVSRKA